MQDAVRAGFVEKFHHQLFSSFRPPGCFQCNLITNTQASRRNRCNVVVNAGRADDRWLRFGCHRRIRPRNNLAGRNRAWLRNPAGCGAVAGRRWRAWFALQRVHFRTLRTDFVAIYLQSGRRSLVEKTHDDDGLDDDSATEKPYGATANVHLKTGVVDSFDVTAASSHRHDSACDAGVFCCRDACVEPIAKRDS